MPKAPPRPCTHPNCKAYAAKDGRCLEHQRKAWATNEGKSRHERGYGSKWDKLRKQILKRDQHLCQVCLEKGIYTKARQVDHKTPKAEGGTDDPNNLQSICIPCHRYKTANEGK